MQTKRDSYYINRILSGHTEDLSIIIDRYKDMVYTLAYRITGNHEDAEELAQDVFIKAYKSLGDFKGRSKFSTWLYSITYNASVSKIRKKHPDYVSMDNYDNTYTEIADKGYEEQYDFDKVPVNVLKKVLDELDTVDKSLLTLYYQEDKSVRELSKITGLTESNVKVRLFRNRKRIFQRLKTILKEELTDLL